MRPLQGSPLSVAVFILHPSSFILPMSLLAVFGNGAQNSLRWARPPRAPTRHAPPTPRHRPGSRVQSPPPPRNPRRGGRDFGAVAQLVERVVRNDEVGSSTLLRSTSGMVAAHAEATRARTRLGATPKPAGADLLPRPIMIRSSPRRYLRPVWARHAALW